MYIDIGETCTIVNQKCPEIRAELAFTRRSWFNQEAFKVSGEVYRVSETGKRIVMYEINGNWNSQVTIKQPGCEPEVVWKKHTYPDLWDH